MNEKIFSLLWRQRIKRRFKVSFPTLIGLCIASVGIIAAALFSDYVTTQSRKDFDAYTAQQTATIANHVQSEVNDHQQLLLGAAALFNTKQSQLTSDDWREYITSTQAITSNPALLGLGYAQVVAAGDLASHEQSMRDAGYTNYSIRLTTTRDTYTSIVFLEPEKDVNKKAIGYDMFSESTRRSAMEAARDTATVGLSEPVQLVQDAGSASATKGVLMYYPVYRYPTIHPQSVEDRRRAIAGYVYAVFRPSDVMKAIDTTTLDLTALDYTINDHTTTLDSHVHNQTAAETPTKHQQTIDVANREWTLSVIAYQPSILSHTSPAGLFLLGTIASMGIGSLVTFALRHRVKSVDEKYRSEMQRTKNELLALASHQLRTPATGVKQYVGLLRDGFVGSVSDTQKAIIDKAYAANERQLETIEQLLYVAKADAGQLLIQRQPTNLTALTSTIIAEMQSSADLQGHIIDTALQPKCCADIDRRFVRMAIENLISNAAKYSQKGSHIRVRLSRDNGHVVLSVQDYGVGIAEDDYSKLFQKFSRIHNALSQSVDGSGLGLFLVRQIMHAHDGDVTVTSEEGSGSMFTLKFVQTSCKKGDTSHDKKETRTDSRG